MGLKYYFLQCIDSTGMWQVNWYVKKYKSVLLRDIKKARQTKTFYKVTRHNQAEYNAWLASR